MAYYLISYDLRTPGQDYTKLYDAIKDFDEWQHPLESTWFIKTEIMKANDIFNKIKPLIDENDLLLIIKVDKNDKQGWLASSFWKWLN